MKLRKLSKCLSDPKGSFDVNHFAKKYFNGGGHVNAAGGVSDLTLNETVDQFLKAIAYEKSQFNI